MAVFLYLTTVLLCLGLASSAQISLSPSYQQKPSQRFNFFDIDLLRVVATSDNDKNVLVSPASVKVTLAMLLEGARGEGADEIREVLRLPNDQKYIRNQLHQFLLSLQTNSPGVTIEGANRIFIADYLSLKPEFSNVLRQNYLSDVTKVNFSRSTEAANTINKWVQDITHGLIPAIVESGSLDSNSMMLLANALYFKGNWQHAFDPKATVVRCFSKYPGSCQDVHMMDITKNFNYAEVHELNAQALEIPYQGGKYSMILLLPNEQTGIAGLVRDLPYKSLSSIVDQMEEQEVQVTLPRFKIDYNTDLVPMLRELGIRQVFGANANLSGIVNSEYNIQVSNVFHKTHIEVNEQGSIAAAVTGAMVIPLMGSTSERFRADHPFVFFIRDLETGSVLFEGKVVEPITAVRTDHLAGTQTNYQISEPQTSPVFGSQPSYVQTQQQPAYNQPQQPAYNQQQPQQPAYNQPQPQPAYNQQQPAYNQPQPEELAYNQQQSAYMPQLNTYTQPQQQTFNQQTSQASSPQASLIEQPIVFINNDHQQQQQQQEQQSPSIIQPVRKVIKVTPPLLRSTHPSPISDSYLNPQQQSFQVTREATSQQYLSQRQQQSIHAAASSQQQQVYPGVSFIPQPQALKQVYQHPLPKYAGGITFEKH